MLRSSPSSAGYLDSPQPARACPTRSPACKTDDLPLTERWHARNKARREIGQQPATFLSNPWLAACRALAAFRQRSARNLKGRDSPNVPTRKPIASSACCLHALRSDDWVPGMWHFKAGPNPRLGTGARRPPGRGGQATPRWDRREVAGSKSVRRAEAGRVPPPPSPTLSHRSVDPLEVAPIRRRSWPDRGLRSCCGRASRRPA